MQDGKLIKRQIARTGTCRKGGQFDAWMEDIEKRRGVTYDI
jgi:hypothetical protein